MTKSTARKMLQMFYDYDRLCARAFEITYPTLNAIAAQWFRDTDCHELTKAPENHLDVFMAEIARASLETLHLVQVDRRT